MKIDKLLHLSAGFVLAVLVTVIMNIWWVILLAPTVCGLLKELVYDKWFKKGTPEWMDWMFTVLGAIIWLVIWQYFLP